MFRFLKQKESSPDLPVTQHSIIAWERDHVRAGVMQLEKGTAQLLGVAAASVHGVDGNSHPDVDRWFAGCDEALTKAEDMTPSARGHKIVPDHVVMSVPSNVTGNLNVTVSETRERPDSSVTTDEIETLLIRGYRKAQDILGTRKENSNLAIIHGSVSAIDLDGKALIDPLGIQGREITLDTNFSMAPNEWIRALEIISERLKLQLVTLVPHYALYAAPLLDASSLLIVVDYDYSLVSLVKRGKIAWAKRIDIGERDIVRATGKSLHLTEHQADALMRTYRAAKLREKAELRLAGIFWQELCRWMGTMATQIQNYQENGPIPHHVYFLDMTRHIPEARSCLETPFWEKSLPFTRCPDITEIKVNMVKDVLDCTAQATGSPYLLLRALAQYVARVYTNKDNFDRLLLEHIDWRHVS
ncbi:MAG: hypothetical protein ACLFV5_03570 [Anaerolineales bacterium]